MIRAPVMLGLLLALGPAVGIARGGTARPGLVWVRYHDTAFQRPALTGTDRQVNLALEGYNDCSQVWRGRIRFPVSGPVTLTAEAQQGVRLYIGDQLVIDGWSPEGVREGSCVVQARQPLPFRLEYYHLGGEAYCRLYWQWEGHARELVPATAFDHTAGDTSPLTTTIAAPTGDEPMCSSIYGAATSAQTGPGPLRLRPGPHLFVDDALIATSAGVTRRVNCPPRDPALPNPIVTGKEDRCFQPYMTILRDPQTGRFRLWYGIYGPNPDGVTSHVGYMESDDGIHWERPFRQLVDPGPIQFGVSVVDDGPDTPDPARRFKLAWWKDGGLKIATSRDGLEWRMLVPQPVLLHNHDINNLWWDAPCRRYVATISVYTTGPTWGGQRRVTLHSSSTDLLHWEKPWYVLTPVDGDDEGETQFYAMCGYIQRGDLWLGMVKVLRDDLVAEGTPEGSYGIGYTTLAWSRDGRHWVRDQEPFFAPDPTPGAWDHAHAWIDCQLPVGDEVYLYYGGYRNGHKVNRYEERQIGLVRMPRDRYVARTAAAAGGTLRTPVVVLEGARLTVNADLRGELRLAILDSAGRPLPGFALADCQPVRGDSLAHRVRWEGLPALPRGRPVQLEFQWRDGDLFGFDLQ